MSNIPAPQPSWKAQNPDGVDLLEVVQKYRAVRWREEHGSEPVGNIADVERLLDLLLECAQSQFATPQQKLNSNALLHPALGAPIIERLENGGDAPDGADQPLRITPEMVAFMNSSILEKERSFTCVFTDIHAVCGQAEKSAELHTLMDRDPVICGLLALLESWQDLDRGKCGVEGAQGKMGSWCIEQKLRMNFVGLL